MICYLQLRCAKEFILHNLLCSFYNTILKHWHLRLNIRSLYSFGGMYYILICGSRKIFLKLSSGLFILFVYSCIRVMVKEDLTMIETGKVVRIEEGKGVIQLESKGGCKSCGMNAICHSTGTSTRELKLELGGEKIIPGDIVEIETPARSVLTAAFLVFILPLLLSMAAYFIVYSSTGSTGLGLAGFFGCFILSEFIIAWIDKSFGRGRFFEPRIVHRLERVVDGTG